MHVIVLRHGIRSLRRIHESRSALLRNRKPVGVSPRRRLEKPPLAEPLPELRPEPLLVPLLAPLACNGWCGESDNQLVMIGACVVAIGILLVVGVGGAEFAQVPEPLPLAETIAVFADVVNKFAVVGANVNSLLHVSPTNPC